jgi:hypothetical protein
MNVHNFGFVQKCWFSHCPFEQEHRFQNPLDFGGDQHVPIHSGYLLQEAVERFIQQDSQSRTGDERRGGTHFSQAFWVMIIAVCLEMGRLSLNEWQFEKGHWRFKPLGFSTSTEKSEK